MKATLTTPHGHKVRTATQSRFVLVGDDGHEAWIERRSDKVSTLEDVQRRRGLRGQSWIFDTTTGEYRVWHGPGYRWTK